MALVKEFKEFALKGNVIDLAVGVVIGAAFGKIVTSFVDDVLMPPLGVLTGGHDFSSYALELAPGAVLRYGVFVNALINFLIISFSIFVVVKRINAWRRKPAEEETPSLRDCPECLSAIPIAAKRCRFCTVAV